MKFCASASETRVKLPQLHNAYNQQDTSLPLSINSVQGSTCYGFSCFYPQLCELRTNIASFTETGERI